MKISIHIDKIETKDAYAEGIDLVIEGVELADLAAIGEMSLEDLAALACECEGECQVEPEEGSPLEALIKHIEEQKAAFEHMKEVEGKEREERKAKEQNDPFADNPFFKVISGQISDLPKNPLTDVLGAFIEAQKEGKNPKF